jgi:tRNA pseudouridine55 synthase
MDGLLIIDKPAGPTSHDVVARMRRVLGERRIGHTGTLDPGASGVLPLVLGRATRLARFLSAGNKQYEAVVRFGVATDTYDAQGTPTGGVPAGRVPTREEIEAALDAFRGTFLQQPPAFSAKKIAGRRSYVAARASRSARPAPPAHPAPPAPPALPTSAALPDPVSVTAHRVDIVNVAADCVTLHVECSAGFYVRSLAHELGVRLAVGAHLAALRRTASAGLTLDDALPLEVAERNRDEAIAAVVPLDRMLLGLASVVLTEAGVERAIHGQDIGAAQVTTGPLPPFSMLHPIRLIDQRGHLVGIAELAATPGLLHPSVVLM